MTEHNDTTEVFYAECNDCGRTKIISEKQMALFDQGWITECDCGAIFGGGDEENWQSMGAFGEVVIG
jgi:hypothetical protein